MPRLTDPAALSRNRARARRIGPVDLLHRITADEIKDRLAEVNRTFRDIAIVSPAADFWAAEFPGAQLQPDTSELALAPGSRDLVIHAMALHWAEDPVGQIVQCARALRPDGLFIAACPGGRSLHELRDVLTRAEAEICGGLSPRVLPMAEIRDLGGLAARAGLAMPVADQVSLRLSYRDLGHLAQDLRAMGEGNALEGRLRRPTRPAVMRRAAELYVRDHPDPDRPGRIRASLDLLFLTGWAPAPGQPRPLRPGSARMSLSQALSGAGKAPE